MIPTLTDEHQELVALVRDVCEREIAPHSADWDAAHHVPMDALRTLGSLGLLGVIIPEEYGGAGLDYTALTLLVEELARYDAGLSVAVAVHAGLCAAPLLRFGSDDQKARYLPRLATGELLGAYALTEPDAGSDTAAIRARATPTGDGWRLDGTKTWITNGGFADFFIVFARTGAAGPKGVSAFLVERREGLSSSKEIPKLGLHTSSTAELVLDGLEVPGEDLVGVVDEGLKIALATLDGGRITIAAQACGIARAALELATAYAQERQAFGGPIARFQGVQFPLADVAAKLAGARLLMLRAAALRDAGRPHSLEGAMAKLCASAVAVEAADMAVQTLGGYGYSAEFPAERLYRDAKITELYEGTSQIQRVVIARGLLGPSARG
jgi:alkylation response protein AidB-like acyl-CoA dehydrogenase